MKAPATFAALLLSACQWMLASPLSIDIEVTSSNTTGPSDATADGCTIRTYESDDCGGSNWAGWDFAPSGCRSCEGVGGDAHSFSLAGNCPWGFISAYTANECAGDKGRIAFTGVGCYPVDTGLPWLSLRPCFYDGI